MDGVGGLARLAEGAAAVAGRAPAWKNTECAARNDCLTVTGHKLISRE